MILVTGGTGMVGAHLLFQLAKTEEKIRAIYRDENSIVKAQRVFNYGTAAEAALFSKIEWCKADITDVPALEEAFEGITKVFHIAALVSFDDAQAKQMRRINISGTANVVNLCIVFSVEKLCFVSSIATIAKAVQKEFISEEEEFNIDTNNYDYAITKYGAEMEVWRGNQEGLKVVIVNPGVILGPGFWNENSGSLFTMTYNKFPFYTEGITGFVGVNDVVKVLLLSMESEVINERFILVAENKSFKEIVFSIADLFQVKKPFLKVNFLIAAIGWRMSWIKSKLTKAPHTFTKHTAKSCNNKSFYTAEKVKSTFNFEFEPIENVLKDCCEKYLRDQKTTK
jgi:dihydroflavonol-4-reductase